MSFRLNLGIGGLCLCVPDPDDQAPTQMHVLLPVCNHVEPHFPVLVFDEAALNGGQATGNAAAPVDLRNAQLDLGPATKTAQSLDPPPAEVANLTKVSGDMVPLPLLTNTHTNGIVNARIRFDAGSVSIAPCGGGDWWMYPQGTSRRLPIRVVWSFVVDQDDTPPLKLTITGINGNTATIDLELFPHKDELNLWVFNSPADQVPLTLPPLTTLEEPSQGDPADHFGCFYHITGSSGHPIPEYDRPAPRIPTECFEPEGEPGLDVTCIVAQALPKP